jgi:hypothetical protein
VRPRTALRPLFRFDARYAASASARELRNDRHLHFDRASLASARVAKFEKRVAEVSVIDTATGGMLIVVEL